MTDETEDTAQPYHPVTTQALVLATRAKIVQDAHNTHQSPPGLSSDAAMLAVCTAELATEIRRSADACVSMSEVMDESWSDLRRGAREWLRRSQRDD